MCALARERLCVYATAQTQTVRTCVYNLRLVICARDANDAAADANDDDDNENNGKLDNDYKIVTSNLQIKTINLNDRQLRHIFYG